MEYILNTKTKQIVKAHDFTIFEDWKTVKFIELTNCEEILTDNKAILKGVIKETGKAFISELTIKEYFDGKFFILDLNMQEQQTESKESKKTIIFKNDDFVIYKSNTVYRVHFFEDENTRNIKDLKSFITKDYNKVIKRLENMGYNLEDNKRTYESNIIFDIKNIDNILHNNLNNKQLDYNINRLASTLKTANGS